VQPAKDFLWPLCQILDAQLSYFCNKKYPKLTSIMSYLKPKKIFRPAIQYLNEIWPVSKKVWPPLLYHTIFFSAMFNRDFVYLLTSNRIAFPSECLKGRLNYLRSILSRGQKVCLRSMRRSLTTPTKVCTQITYGELTCDTLALCIKTNR
jgi:hypothetical protein